jgi:endonuclease YncB( thermonuclease family)
MDAYRSLILVLCLLGSSVLAADPSAPLSALPAEVVSVHDGDTLTVIVRCPLLKVVSEPLSVRAAGYDTWELTRARRTKTVRVTAAEIVRGKAALADFKLLLASGQLFLEDSGQTDLYGRLSAILWIKTADGWVLVAKWMEDRGHLRTPRTE